MLDLLKTETMVSKNQATEAEGPRAQGPNVPPRTSGPRPLGPWDLRCQEIKVRGPMGQGLMTLEPSKLHAFFISFRSRMDKIELTIVSLDPSREIRVKVKKTMSLGILINRFSEIIGVSAPGVPPSPCFPIFLARTTFVLESLPEAKNPGQDAFLGDFVFNSSYSRDNSLLD